MCCGEPTGQLEDETCQHFPKTCAVLHSLPSVMWMYNATRCTNGAIAERRPLRLLNAAKLVHSGRNSAQNSAQTGSGSGQEDNGSCRKFNLCERTAGVCPFPPATVSPKEAAQPAGVAAFYKLKPGTVVPMHNGPTNQRLKCQVGAAASCRRRSRRRP